MTYVIKTEAKFFWPATPVHLRLAHPNVSFPADLDMADYTDWHCYPVQDTLPPNAPGKIAERIMPVQIEGVWFEQWTLVDAPAPAVPQIVSMRQARLALLDAGLLDDVEAAIITMAEPQRAATQIEWEYSTEVNRTSPTTAMLAGVLGLTDEQIDELFRQAAGL